MSSMYTRGAYIEMLIDLRVDRLIDWYKANKPEWSGNLTLPRMWKGLKVEKLVIEQADTFAGVPVHRGHALTVQGSDALVSRREISRYIDSRSKQFSI